MAILATAISAAATVMLAAATASALPGDASDEALQLLPQARACPVRGSICVRPGAPSTLAAGTLPTASLAKTAPVPVLARAPGHEGAWTLALDVSTRRPAWAGNALFLVYDADDAEAIAAREVTALHQATVAAGSALSARLTLDPDDGFRAGKTYLVQVAQLIDGKEIVLAEARFSLR